MMETLTTIDTARRLLRSHGIDDAQLAERAKLLRREWEAAQQEAEHAIAEQNGDDVEPMAPETVWLLGSVRQLQRQWGGRCCSCVHWDEYNDLKYNTVAPATRCRRIIDAETDALIEVPWAQDAPITAPAFGCILWGEIPAEDAETLRARAELAMEIGLLPKAPLGH